MICIKRKWKAIKVLNREELAIFASSFCIDEHIGSSINHNG